MQQMLGIYNCKNFVPQIFCRFPPPALSCKIKQNKIQDGKVHTSVE
jgi:hypothetical protein